MHIGYDPVQRIMNSKVQKKMLAVLAYMAVKNQAEYGKDMLDKLESFYLFNALFYVKKNGSVYPLG